MNWLPAMSVNMNAGTDVTARLCLSRSNSRIVPAVAGARINQ
jgi:hypothetical protein